MKRREVLKQCFAPLVATIPGVVEPIETDTEPLMIVFRCDRNLSENAKHNIQRTFADARERYPQLKDVPLFICDAGTSLELIKRPEGV